jgi:hypothetical protein
LVTISNLKKKPPIHLRKGSGTRFTIPVLVHRAVEAAEYMIVLDMIAIPIGPENKIIKS